MTVYLIAHAFGAIVMVGIFCAATALEAATARHSITVRPSHRAQQENAPTPPYRVHSGDYSAWQASSIEGESDHV